MNGPEKNVLFLALCLLIVGIVVRYIPWGLPSIESFQVGGDLVVSVSDTLVSPSKEIRESSKLEQAVPVIPDIPDQSVIASDNDVLNNVTNGGLEPVFAGSPGDISAKKPKKEKKSKKTVKLPLHINTASAEDLCALNGVGPKLAEKIIAFRQANGPIKNSADLKKVPGIGVKKLEAILPGVIFD